MAQFVYLYTGGQMAATPEAQEAAMQAWGSWFGTLGDAVTDPGHPFGPSSATLSNGGESAGGASGIGGYSIISAGSLADATSLAKGCPVLVGGGSVEVYEALPM